jgi:hypothetical protein
LLIFDCVWKFLLLARSPPPTRRQTDAAATNSGESTRRLSNKVSSSSEDGDPTTSTATPVVSNAEARRSLQLELQSSQRMKILSTCIDTHHNSDNEQSSSTAATAAAAAVAAVVAAVSPSADPLGLVGVGKASSPSLMLDGGSESRRPSSRRSKKKPTEITRSFTAPVDLDVGGVRYRTSLSTLQSVPESMLGAMFSGRFELARQPDGSIFIDRDGRLFGHVLNWLRDRQVAPLTGADRAQLRAEASFYQLNALLAVLDEEDSAISVQMSFVVFFFFFFLFLIFFLLLLLLSCLAETGRRFDTLGRLALLCLVASQQEFPWSSTHRSRSVIFRCDLRRIIMFFAYNINLFLDLQKSDFTGAGKSKSGIVLDFF